MENKTAERTRLLDAAVGVNANYRNDDTDHDLELGFLYGTAEMIVALTLKDDESYHDLREELARAIDALAAEQSYPLLECNGWKPTTPATTPVKLREDGDMVVVYLPDGRDVTISLNDIEEDSLPQLEIELPSPMVANCWLEDMKPGNPLRGSRNAINTLRIHIPIESAESSS
jgi:hypothetical protein